MDCAVGSIKERQGKFLGDCLRIIENDLCGKDREKSAFYMNCIIHLSSHDSLTTTQIRECDKNEDEDKKKEDKTYRKWLHNLTKFPKIVYVQGVKGREAYFYVDSGASTTVENVVPDVDESAGVVGCGNTTIRYNTEKISRAPWYLRVANPLFKTQKTRRIFAMSAVFCVFLFLPFAIGYIYFFHKEDPLQAALFALLLIADLFFWSPTLKIFRLAIRKIAIVDSIKLPLSSVCISEITRVAANDLSAIERRLSVVTVSANCPICKKRYGLESSVLLEEKGLLNNQIIGVCHNNPMMHRYSFDKDLMAGERLQNV